MHFLLPICGKFSRALIAHQIFLNQSCSFCKEVILSYTETSGVDSGIFCDRNFGISNPNEVSNEVSAERKPETLLCKNVLPNFMAA
jgi:hypothetical protein